MPLTWDSTACDLPDTLSDDDAVTRESLIFATMAVGMNTITVENAREFFARASFWEKVNGAYRYDSGGSVFFKPEDVLRFVGLRTNASTKTKAQFYKSVWESHDRFNVPRSM